MLKKLFSIILAVFLSFSFSVPVTESAEGTPATEKKISKKSKKKSYHKKKRAKSKKSKKKSKSTKKKNQGKRVRKSHSSYSSPESIDSQKEWIDKQIDKYKSPEDI